MPCRQSLVWGTPAVVLAWLGRQGTRAIAALVFIGIGFPSVGAALKPYITAPVFVLLCTAFMRVDTRALKGFLRRPVLVLTATAWTSLAVPVLVGAGAHAVGLDRHAPDLFLALMLQALASPMMAAPALAALMGLDATLVLVSLVAGTALVPLTAPFFAFVFIGPALAMSPTVLGVKLFAILAGAALVGGVVRRLVGHSAIERHGDKINGLNVLALFVFVAAMMESVGTRFIAAPASTMTLCALAFTAFFVLLFLTALVFRRAGRERALALGFMAAQRNMGLMLAATGGAVPEMVWLYIALSQFPIYLSPYLMHPLVRRVLARTPDASASVRRVE